MRTHKTGANLARRGLTAVAGLAVVAGTLVGIAAPASAGVTAASIDISVWPVGTSPAVTVSITNDAALTSPFVIVEWDWLVSYGSMTTDTVDVSGNSNTCHDTGITFTAATSWTANGTSCTYTSGGAGDPTHSKVTLVGAQTAGSISVHFPASTVTATDSARGYGTWTVIPNLQFRVTTSAGAGAAPLYTLDLDPNGGECLTAKVQGYANSWGNAPASTDCTRTGYTFTGWNTSANGSGTGIAPHGNINFTGDNRVYAQWLDRAAAFVTPGTVTKVIATSKWNRVQVNWDAPVSSGSGPILNYLVKSSVDGKVCVTSVTKDRKPTQCSFNTLVPGASYTFTVQALNGGGWGANSAVSNAAAPYSLQITKSERRKVFFGLGGSTIKLVASTPGYAPGVQVTPSVSYDGGKTWSKLKGNGFRTKAAIANNVSLKIARGSNNAHVLVKFIDAGGNESNVVNVAPAR